MMNRLFRKKGGFTLIELMIVVAIIGILAAIAIPNFIRFQAKSKQSEAKTNLKAIFTAQKAYFGEKDKYQVNFTVIGFDPEAGNRYSYGLATGCAAAVDATQTARRAGATLGCIGQDALKFPAPPAAADAVNNVGVNPTIDDCPNCFFSATAIGNVDNDPEGDTWGITSATVAGEAVVQAPCGIDEDTPNGLNLVAGEPTNAFNDVSCGG
ncbi:prepilin-type N-terminal cleavage/methylation domain-containing protein [Corallococcus praedator]|uniref:Prepilin-type N-terminal cleavage/methylation domain-containing protein n=1 Tax=Corallococcus praedator TaxID=2316724 RepID=A0ABX9QLT0_9BACT|nr:MULTISPECIES: prepilin-type N-terminal cleavage/methylation domain-containing protein [Corallococcus]RKH16831.1 prepilin-type N-terminal cleavage/methylation domain-containing protein [Corallococcus sp. CA047B]RKH33515.1 prepilin-type N-terminal cleavage/methylation domain-containing protein [Corallococcus sp. CA031C]RKI11705.1 prepilin-type N-terminal cleavage/methylation domain-containing protein [Corallococcus praedator]